MLAHKNKKQAENKHHGQSAARGNSNGSDKHKAFTLSNQLNAQAFVPINVQAANGGFAIVATLVDININSVVVKSAKGGNASNRASFNNDMNQSNDA